jgi:hypothetical protein
MLVLEVKGQDNQELQTKREFLTEWVRAVNEHGGFARWSRKKCRLAWSHQLITFRHRGLGLGSRDATSGHLESDAALAFAGRSHCFLACTVRMPAIAGKGRLHPCAFAVSAAKLLSFLHRALASRMRTFLSFLFGHAQPPWPVS